MTHMPRIGRTFYARLIVPKDLQPLLGCTELKQSLRTKNFKEAKQLLFPVLDNWNRTFFQLRYSGMTQKPPTRKEIEVWLKQNPGKAWIPDDLRYSIFSPKITASQINRILLDAGYEPDENGMFDTTKPPQNAPATYQQMQPATLTAEQHDAISLPAEPIPATAKRRDTKCLTVPQAIEQFLCSEQVKALSGLGRGNTQLSYRQRLSKLADHAGNKPLEDINDYAFLYDLVNTTLRPHALSYRKSIIDVIRQMLEYHYKRKALSAPAPDIEVIESVVEKHTRKQKKPNASYPDTSLQILFRSFVEAPAKRINNADQRYNHVSTVYASLLALYTAHRISDLAHLRASDFDFTATIPNLLQENQLLTETAPDGSVKAKMSNKTASTLRIPLHKHLLSIGLQKFISRFKPEEKPFSNASTIAQRLDAQLKVAGIKQAGQLVHALRKTLDNKYIANSTPRDIKETLMNHAVAGTAASYDDPAHLSQFELPSLNKYVQKIDYKIDFTPIREHLEKHLSLLTRK